MAKAPSSRPVRGLSRDRHGRGMRSPVTGPRLPLARTRDDAFDAVVAEAVDYLRGLWPGELTKLRVLVADAPDGEPGPAGVERWRVDRRSGRVVLFRVPIERLAHLHVNDAWHRRSYLESCVFRAVAELLGRDPWEIAPERFRHY